MPRQHRVWPKAFAKARAEHRAPGRVRTYRVTGSRQILGVSRGGTVELAEDRARVLLNAGLIALAKEKPQQGKSADETGQSPQERE